MLWSKNKDKLEKKAVFSKTAIEPQIISVSDYIKVILVKLPEEIKFFLEKYIIIQNLWIFFIYNVWTLPEIPEIAQNN